MLTKNKIASVTVSLSWVFMIIVGSFFILTSYNIISKYKDNESEKYRIELEKALRNIFNEFGRTAGVEESSLAPLKDIFKNSQVQIECNEELPLMVINGNYFENSYISTHPTFMTKIDQKSISQTYLAVENFRYPFKITNMMAIISLKNLIIFDNDSDIGIQLHNKFKKGAYRELNYDIISFTDLGNFEENNVKGLNLNSITFVTDKGRLNNNIQEIIKEKSGAYSRIDKYGIEIGQNDLTYFYLDDDSTIQELGPFNLNSNSKDNSLSLETMSVFSSPQNFECSYNLLFKSIIASYEFYELKSESFSKNSTHFCSTNLLTQRSLYQNIKEELKLIKEEIDSNSNLNQDLSDIRNSQLKLEEENCPYIY